MLNYELLDEKEKPNVNDIKDNLDFEENDKFCEEDIDEILLLEFQKNKEWNKLNEIKDRNFDKIILEGNLDKLSLSEEVSFLKLIQHKNHEELKKLLDIKQISSGNQQYLFKSKGTDNYRLPLKKLKELWIRENLKELYHEEKMPNIIDYIVENITKLNWNIETLEAIFNKLRSIKKISDLNRKNFNIWKIHQLISSIEELSIEKSVFVNFFLQHDWDSLDSFQNFLHIYKFREKIKKQEEKLSEDQIDELVCCFGFLLQRKSTKFEYLNEFINYIQIENVDKFIATFAIIQDYSLRLSEIAHIFEEIPDDSWAASVYKMGIANQFPNVRKIFSRDNLINEYRRLNPSRDDKENHFKMRLEKIESLTSTFSSWNEYKIREWAEGKRGKKDIDINEAIAVMSRTACLLYQPDEKNLGSSELFSVRDTQRLALSVLLSDDKEKCLAEIKTGEGKSLVVAMLATFLALQGKQVDIVTSSSELAKRDATNQQRFYDFFGLKAKHNILENHKDIQSVYQSDIVYGDAGHFQADLLRQNFLKEETRGKRTCDAVIVDEVDSMLLDQGSDSTRLAEPFPGAHHLNYVFASIWRQLQECDQKMGDNINQIDEDTLSGEIYTAVMNSSGSRWYTDEDIRTYIRHIIDKDLGGLADNKSYLLKKQWNGYHVAVLEACADSSASSEDSSPIDFYFNKKIQPAPENKERDNRLDIFDELKSILFSNDSKPIKSKILFPYNVSGNHWTLAEVCIEKKDSTSNFQINVFVHNPYGMGKMNENDFVKLSSAIRSRLQEIDSSCSEKIDVHLKESPYTKARQAITDTHSCGVIVAHELLKRIKDESLNRVDGCYPVGCQELRHPQRDSIKNEYTLLVVNQKPSNQPSKNICCWQEEKNGKTAWQYSLGSDINTLFDQEEEKQSGSDKRILGILRNRLDNSPINDDEIYTVIAYILSKARVKDHAEKSRFVQNNQTNYPVPAYMRPLFLQELPYWIESALQAKYRMNLGVEYRIGEKNEILPVDHSSTGVTQANTQWEKGLHQFLQLKHQVPITPLSLTTNFLSVSSFFQKYKQILGVTGTLGSKAQHQFFKETYGVNHFFMPSFKERQLVELATAILPDREKWRQRIVANALREALAGRAVLLVCHSDLVVNELKEALLQEIKKIDTDKPLKVKKYSNESDPTHRTAIQEKAEPGDIIVATNLAGRGTDINISEQVESNKGLHTCITFLPKTKRTLIQAAGRGGRKGQPGTWQMILDESTLIEEGYEHTDDIKAILSQRDQREKRNLRFLQNEQKMINGVKEELFSDFCNYLNKYREKPYRNNQDKKDENIVLIEEVIKIKLRGIKERWAIWLQTNFNEDALSSLSLEDLTTRITTIKDQFEMFKTCLDQDIENDNVFINPYQMILLGNAYINLGNAIRDTNKAKAIDYYDQAIRYYQKARIKDDYCGWLSYHNEAFALAAKSDKTRFRSGKIYALPEQKEQKSSSEDKTINHSDSSSPSTVSSDSKVALEDKISDQKPEKIPEPNDSNLVEAQRCLIQAKARLETQVLPALQSTISLMYTDPTYSLEFVNQPPENEQLKRKPNKILLYKKDESWNYYFCKDIVHETCAQGKIGDEKMVGILQRLSSAEDSRQVGELSEETEEMPIITHILAAENMPISRDRTPLMSHKNQEILFYQDMIDKIDHSLRKIGEYDQIQIGWQSLELNTNPHQLELTNMGFQGCMDVEKYTPPSKFPWEVLLVGLIALAQVVAGGILIATGVGVSIGMGLIGEGVGDMLFAIEAGINGEFSWQEYGIQKAISIAISLATAAAASLARYAGRLIKTGVTIAKASRVGQMAGKVISQAKNFVKSCKPLRKAFVSIKDKVSRFKWVKASQKGFVKKSVEKAAESKLTTITKYVAKEIVEQGSIKLLSFAFEKTALKLGMEELKKQIKEKLVSELSNDTDFVNDLHRIMGYDVYFKTSVFENKFYEGCTESFADHTPEWQQTLQGGLRQWGEKLSGELFKTNSTKGYKKILSTVAEPVIFASMVSAKIAEVVMHVNKMIPTLSDKVKRIKSIGEYHVSRNLTLTEDNYKSLLKGYEEKEYKGIHDIYPKLKESQLIDDKNYINIKTEDDATSDENGWNKIKSFEISVRAKELLFQILKHKKLTQNKEIEHINEKYQEKVEHAIDYLATIATEKVVGVVTQETTRCFHYTVNKAVSFIGNKLGGKQLKERLEQFGKKSTESHKDEKQKLGSVDKIDQTKKYDYLIQKTIEGNMGVPCRGNALHLEVLSEQHSVSVQIYDKNKNLIHEIHPEKSSSTKSTLRLQYDNENKGHYSYLELDQGRLITKEFTSREIGKNDCLFACFDYHLTQTEPTSERINSIRKVAAQQLGEKRQEFSKLYSSSINLLKGGRRPRHAKQNPHRLEEQSPSAYSGHLESSKYPGQINAKDSDHLMAIKKVISEKINCLMQSKRSDLRKGENQFMIGAASINVSIGNKTEIRNYFTLSGNGCFKRLCGERRIAGQILKVKGLVKGQTTKFTFVKAESKEIFYISKDALYVKNLDSNEFVKVTLLGDNLHIMNDKLYEKTAPTSPINEKLCAAPQLLLAISNDIRKNGGSFKRETLTMGEMGYGLENWPRNKLSCSCHLCKIILPVMMAPKPEPSSPRPSNLGTLSLIMSPRNLEGTKNNNQQKTALLR